MPRPTGSRYRSNSTGKKRRPKGSKVMAGLAMIKNLQRAKKAAEEDAKKEAELKAKEDALLREEQRKHEEANGIKSISECLDEYKDKIPNVDTSNLDAKKAELKELKTTMSRSNKRSNFINQFKN